jgi:hypothetical protein
MPVSRQAGTRGAGAARKSGNLHKKSARILEGEAGFSVAISEKM